MHCSDEQLLKHSSEHSEQTRQHIASCEQCQMQLALLQRLRTDAQAMPVIKPRAMAWDKVKANLPKTPVAPVVVESAAKSKQESNVVHVSFMRRYKLPLAVAASFAVGVLVTNINHQFDKISQLDEQIALSSQYESQLVALRMTSPLIERQLWQISEIDQQLNQSLTVKERKQLWLKRNEILRQMLTTPTHSSEMI